MVHVSPVRLKEKMQRIDVADAFVCTDDQDVVEDESVWNGVGVADRDEHQTEYERARRGLGREIIEQAHPKVLKALECCPLSIG